MGYLLDHVDDFISHIIVNDHFQFDTTARSTPTSHVCTNCVDPDDWPADPEHNPDGKLRVGWAGSWSHAYDVADIEQQPHVTVVWNQSLSTLAGQVVRGTYGYWSWRQFGTLGKVSDVEAIRWIENGHG